MDYTSDWIELYFTPAPRQAFPWYLAVGIITLLVWFVVMWVCHLVCARYDKVYLEKSDKD